MKSTLTLILCTTGFASAQMITCPADAPANVKLAAKEIRRHVYLCTGEWLSIAATGKAARG